MGETRDLRKLCGLISRNRSTRRHVADYVAVSRSDIQISGEQLTELYREHAGVLYGYARFLTHTVPDAEDLVQVTFLQAYRALERGEQLNHPRAWLMTTMRRRALNLARDRHDIASDALSAQAATTDVTSTAAINEQLDAVRTALHQLPDSQRHAFVLRHWSGLSAREIAEVMDTSEPSVQSLLSRARTALRSDRKLARASDALTGMVFIPSQSISDSLGELIPGFGGNAAGAGTVAVTGVGAGKLALAIKGAVALVAATGVVAVGHQHHLDVRALQAAGIEQPHHHGGTGVEDHGGSRGADAHGHGRGGADDSGRGRGRGGENRGGSDGHRRSSHSGSDSGRSSGGGDSKGSGGSGGSASSGKGSDSSGKGSSNSGHGGGGDD